MWGGRIRRRSSAREFAAKLEAKPRGINRPSKTLALSRVADADHGSSEGRHVISATYILLWHGDSSASRPEKDWTRGHA